MCEYVFDPDQCINRKSIRDNRWECQRKSLESTDRCKYHANAADLSNKGLSEEQVFVQLLNEDRKIFGANFQSICLTSDDIENIESDSADILNAEFYYFEIKGADLELDLNFKGCEFTSYNENNTTNRRNREFFGCHLNGTFNFTPESNFQKTEFNQCRFSGPVQIEGEYRGVFTIQESWVNNTLKIAHAEFKNGCELSNSKFRGEVHVTDISVPDELLIKSVELPLKTIISECDINSIKSNPQKGLPSLVDVRNGTKLSSGSLMNGDGGDVYYDLSYATIGNLYLDLDNADWEHYFFQATTFSDFRFIDYEDKIRKNKYELHTFGYSDDLFYESRLFPDGMFYQNDAFPDTLNLSEGVFVSDVPFIEDCYLPEDIQPNNCESSEECDRDEELADHETWFPADLFLEDGEQEGDRVLPSEDYEERTALRNHTETYTRAKNHAQSNGIGSLVSGFHVLQRRAERAKYVSRSRSESSLAGKLSNRRRSCQNGFLRWLYNYGEGTYYPLGWSVVSIVTAAALYVKLGVISEETTISTVFDHTFTHYPASTWVEGIQYSILVFTTLGMDSNSPETLFQGMIVSIESALGAILIALFVFTLGKQANR